MKTYLTDNDGTMAVEPHAAFNADPHIGVLPNTGLKVCLFGRTATGAWVPMLVDSTGALVISNTKIWNGTADPNALPAFGALGDIYIQFDGGGNAIAIWTKGALGWTVNT